MEFKNSIGGDGPRDGLISISEMGTDTKKPLAANTHTLDPVLQTGNRAPLANAKRILLILPDQPTPIQKKAVSNFDSRASMGARAIADFDVLIFDTGATPLHR